MTDEKLKRAYGVLEYVFLFAQDEGLRFSWADRPDGKLEITSDGDEYVVTLEPK